MKSNRGYALLAFGIVLIAIGLLWTLQGLGVIGGSVMSGATMWAVIGPIVALVGVYLLVRRQRARHG